MFLFETFMLQSEIIHSLMNMIKQPMQEHKRYEKSIKTIFRFSWRCKQNIFPLWWNHLTQRLQIVFVSRHNVWLISLFLLHIQAYGCWQREKNTNKIKTIYNNFFSFYFIFSESSKRLYHIVYMFYSKHRPFTNSWRQHDSLVFHFSSLMSRTFLFSHTKQWKQKKKNIYSYFVIDFCRLLFFVWQGLKKFFDMNHCFYWNIDSISYLFFILNILSSLFLGELWCL